MAKIVNVSFFLPDYTLMNDAVSQYTETWTVINLTKQGIKAELFYNNWLFYYC